MPGLRGYPCTRSAPSWAAFGGASLECAYGLACSISRKLRHRLLSPLPSTQASTMASTEVLQHLRGTCRNHGLYCDSQSSASLLLASAKQPRCLSEAVPTLQRVFR